MRTSSSKSRAWLSLYTCPKGRDNVLLRETHQSCMKVRVTLGREAWPMRCGVLLSRLPNALTDDTACLTLECQDLI